jgi:glutaredoxin
MKKNILWWIIGLVIVGVLISFLVVQGKKPGKYDALAQCINDSGAKFYAAWWCPHCQATKALFGKAHVKLPYIECQTKSRKQTQECTDAGITGYPTWIFADGSRISGERTLEELAEKTSCQAPLAEANAQ